MRKEGQSHTFFQKEFTWAHLRQSLYAALFILLVFFLMERMDSQLAVASLGASAAIAFSFPNTQSARARFLIGGYCIGCFSGIVGWHLILLLEQWTGWPVTPRIAGCCLAVFLTMLLMTVLNFEHPPSAALSIAVATWESPYLIGGVAIGAILLLCGIKYLLRNRLVNL